MRYFVLEIESIEKEFQLVDARNQIEFSLSNDMKNTLADISSGDMILVYNKVPDGQVHTVIKKTEGDSFIKVIDMHHGVALDKYNSIVSGLSIRGLTEIDKDQYDSIVRELISYVTQDNEGSSSKQLKEPDETLRKHDGKNIILYGVPGAGKSHKIATEYCDDETRMQRVVFHPDYTYSDFVGQILPELDENGKLEYKFTPGPFTSILKKAQYDPENTYYLIVEEINRGNAPAIFGEIFQLLDRYSEDDKKVDDNPELLGWSEYGITNYDIAREVYGDREHLVKIPSNLSIIATMNTADQNVFTLDTAFQRRWEMEHIPNDIDNCEYADEVIADTGITWRAFAKEANKQIIEGNALMGDSGDKRLGAYFVRVSELRDKRKFSEKVLKYLWDDALKMDRSKLFNNNVGSVDSLIEKFEQGGSSSMKSVIVENAYNDMIEIAKEYNERISAAANPGNDGETDGTDE